MTHQIRWLNSILKYNELNLPDPYKDEHLPIAPDELIAQISNRYIQIFELITGETFSFGKIENNFEKRMMDNIINYI
jgi:phosphoribosylaminoimidazole-succinocarboxamide synthase